MIKTLVHTKRWAFGALVALVGLASLLAFNVAPVQAQSSGPDGSKRNAALEQALVRLRDWSTKQEINLRHARTAGDKVQQLIDRANGKGKDTAALVSALADYRAALGEAQADHENAAAVLAEHAGFDDAGKVVDAQTARQTLVSARKALNDAHITLAQAAANLRAAVNDWRDAQTSQ